MICLSIPSVVSTLRAIRNPVPVTLAELVWPALGHTGVSKTQLSVEAGAEHPLGD